MPKCELCGRIYYDDDIILIKREFIHKGIMKGYICKNCYNNFMRFPNKIVFDGKKWWYVSDPVKFPDNWKLTFNYSDKAAFREFNPKHRIFELQHSILGRIKVSYYWVFKKGGIRKGPYFWEPDDKDVFKHPREVKAKIRALKKD